MSKKITRIPSAITIFILLSQTVYASGDFASSTIATGTRRLIQDVTTWALVIVPLIGGLCTLYFFVRRGAADEQDQRKWNNRIVVAIVSTIGAVLAASIISLVTGYYT
ncbi:MAG: hypothetical protein FWH08_00345 [Oscillospiraceae bacterium]|nr:hypothetical protein [Oscillospiraceae bacterium]